MKYIVKINIEREVEAGDESEAVSNALDVLESEEGNSTLATRLCDLATATPVKDQNEVKSFSVTYRGELEVEIEAKDEDAAAYLAERSAAWSFIGEGHKDLFEVNEIEQE